MSWGDYDPCIPKPGYTGLADAFNPSTKKKIMFLGLFLYI